VAVAQYDDGLDQVDYFSSENILKFADHLYETGDFLRAAGEYQRYLTAVAYEQSSDSIYYKVIRSRFFGEDYVRCHQYLDNYAMHYPRSSRISDINLLKAIVYSSEGNYEISNALASGVESGDLPLRALIPAVNYTKLGEFELARSISCSQQDVGSVNVSPYLPDLESLCRKLGTADPKYKSPFLAASLAIVPGAGKLYCGNAGDAFNSAFLIGLLGYLSYDGFHDDGRSSVRGWVFGTLGCGFYAGNIYGSAIAARLYNRKVKDDFIMGINIDVSLP
jgi:hypothetical protein